MFFVEKTYDANGNLTRDSNKKIAKIQYNILNLPSALQFTEGHTSEYLYDAAGVKRKVKQVTTTENLLVPMGSMLPVPADKVAVTTLTDYCGNVIYENGALSRIIVDGGYITMSGTTPTYHYYIQDHQGNNRVVFNQNGTVEQTNHYYPFGMTFGEGIDNSDNRYKYNGKELDHMHGLDLYDYGARHYDAAIGRWGVIDPLAEKYYSVSPYAYCANNPINAIDPNGRVVIFINGLWGLKGMPISGGTVNHWGRSWVQNVQNRIGDHRAMFFDGSSFNMGYGRCAGNQGLPYTLSSSFRTSEGYKMGASHAADIVRGLQRDCKGNITESIKFVTSSMGAAYERGFSRAITDYVIGQNKMIDAYNATLEKNNDGTYKDPSLVKQHLNVNIEFNIDLDGFQGCNLPADPNASSNYYMINDGFESVIIGSPIPGGTQIGVDANGNTTMHGHHPSWADPNAMPRGRKNPIGSSTYENN